jgi:peptidylprolyl isomerase
MKKYFFTIPLVAVGSLFATAQETTLPEEITQAAELPKMEMKDINFAKLSETFGHMMGKHLESLGFEIELAKVFQGIELAFKGSDAPMSESECFQAISLIQENNHKKSAADNLSQAEAFLEKNAKQKGIVKLEANKLQYKVTHQGKGEIVKAGDAPKIRYKGTFLDGNVFGESQEDEHISLGEIIEGLSKGVIGMKEGEKRTLYIHPDLAYKDAGGVLPPNSMLTFEIELVKANEPIEMPEDFTAEDDTLPETGDELASSNEQSQDAVAR